MDACNLLIRQARRNACFQYFVLSVLGSVPSKVKPCSPTDGRTNIEKLTFVVAASIIPGMKPKPPVPWWLYPILVALAAAGTWASWTMLAPWVGLIFGVSASFILSFLTHIFEPRAHYTNLYIAVGFVVAMFTAMLLRAPEFVVNILGGFAILYFAASAFSSGSRTRSTTSIPSTLTSRR